MAPKTYPPYLREKARQLRRERKLTIDQLAECLALPRTTVYYWVRDSNQLNKQTWRSVYGVLTVRVNDTYLMAGLQAWMDCLQEQWLDSVDAGRGATW